LKYVAGTIITCNKPENINDVVTFVEADINDVVTFVEADMLQ